MQFLLKKSAKHRVHTSYIRPLNCSSLPFPSQLLSLLTGATFRNLCDATRAVDELGVFAQTEDKGRTQTPEITYASFFEQAKRSANGD